MKSQLEMILPLLIEVSMLRMAVATECSSALGMDSGAIADNQLSESSSYSSNWRAKEARLNKNRAWFPNTNSRTEWLQIDLLEKKVISGIQTQGYQWRSWSTSYYVKSFKLSHSDDETIWNIFQENGSDKIFVGNSNANGVKANDIDPPIRARFIRLMAETWQAGIAVRLELLGCEIQATTTQMSSTTTTTRSTTNAVTTVATTTLMTTKRPTTHSSSLNPYTMTSTKKTSVTPAGVTPPAVPQRSTSPVNAVSGMTSPSSNNTSGNSDELAGNQAGTTSAAIIGGAAAAGVVILIVAIVLSIFFIRRRRSKAPDDKEPSTLPDETGTVDNIYYGGVRFAANGNASTNGNVSIDQSGGMVDNDLYAYAGTTNGDVMIDQSEGMVDNDLYAGTPNGNAAVDQSEGTVDYHLYAATGDTSMGSTHHGGDDSAQYQYNVYYNVAHTTDEGSVENDIYC
ncbi:uncharacterized protein LOC144876110 [Branchiostoma floridae x Branchiostoma japonicum]